MPTARAFAERIDTPITTLSPEESHHLAVVLRAQVGQVVELFDGAGGHVPGVLAVVKKKSVTVAVRGKGIATAGFDWPFRLTLAVALPRSHRQSYLVEKCTELGAAGLQPLMTDRSVARPDRNLVGKWQRRAAEAAKQCGQYWLPAIHEPAPLATALQAAAAQGAVLFAHARMPDSATPPSGPQVTSLFSALRSLQTGVPAGAADGVPGPDGAIGLTAFVGPEGGWSPAETDLAQQLGATFVSLTPTILRIETAAVAIAAAAGLLME